jgi:hypothetical protein
MSTNYGKSFEQKFKNDFLKIPNSTIDRLYDTQNGYKSISQISDYIGYVFPNIFYLEIKSIHGNTFPLTNLTQYNKLVPKEGIKGVRVGVIIWFVDHDQVAYVPISTIKKMKKDGKKSVNVKMLTSDEYNIIIIPSTKKRVFLDSDYSVLLNLNEGE